MNAYDHSPVPVTEPNGLAHCDRCKRPLVRVSGPVMLHWRHRAAKKGSLAAARLHDERVMRRQRGER